MEHVVDSRARNDANQLLKDAAAALGVLDQIEEREQSLQERQIRAFCDAVSRLSRRLDAYEAKRRAQARRDEEAERQAIRDYLDSLPDPESPNPGGELSPIGPVTPPDPETPRQLAGVGADTTDINDQIPEPKDPSGTTLEL